MADPQPPGLAALRREARGELRATASSSPETTTDVGPLTAAMLDRRSVEQRADLVLGGLRPRPSRRPSGSACISRPRAATSVAASASDSTPATCAAASSPIEWPTRKSGRTPQDSSSRNSATSKANSAGWV